MQSIVFYRNSNSAIKIFNHLYSGVSDYVIISSEGSRYFIKWIIYIPLLILPDILYKNNGVYTRRNETPVLCLIPMVEDKSTCFPRFEYITFLLTYILLVPVWVWLAENSLKRKHCKHFRFKWKNHF